jgi:indoleamine 2,3-dioxygenase
MWWRVTRATTALTRRRVVAVAGARARATAAPEEVLEFTVGPHNGFLPLHEPLVALPPAYKELESLLQRMPVTRPDGTAGLLARGELGAAVQAELPEYDAATLARADPRLLAALYRDYTFLTSAYLLEPCDVQYRRDGTYGLGRDRLPANIARPLKAVADRVHARPFMEYAMTYALYNWRRRDPRHGLAYDNLALIRTLHGGAAEHGFILVHVAMVAHTGDLVRNTERALAAASARDTSSLYVTLQDYQRNLAVINQVMETMWARSEVCTTGCACVLHVRACVGVCLCAVYVRTCVPVYV